MKWKYFKQLTYLKTTPLDAVWLLLAAGFSYWSFGRFNWLYAIWAFFVVFLFHLLVNMQNDYEDYVHATDKTDYKRRTNTIGKYQLDLKMVKHWIIGLGFVAVAMGLLLALFTGWPTLIIGIIAAIFGLGYSAGPVPLNSTPFCELCDSIPIGFLIPLTYVYLGSLNEFPFSWSIVLQVFLVTLGNVLIMYITQLANDTCDLEEDEGNGRHTLVHFIGKTNALKIFFTIFWLTILVTPMLVLLHLAPAITLLVIPLYPVSYSHIKVLKTNQSKSEIYNSEVVKWLSNIMISYIILYLIGAIIDLILF